MKLLLHICCAPCLIYPLEKLRKDGFEVGGFFYNPNIHPLGEYQKRRTAVEDFAAENNIEVIFPEYAEAEFLNAVGENNEIPQRCSICWSLRLKRTAREAKEAGFDSFTTTLLVSPYQDLGLLRKIGEDAAQTENLEFYYEDFRPGFRVAHDQAKAKGIYCQKYCGCIYSEMERCRKSAKL